MKYIFILISVIWVINYLLNIIQFFCAKRFYKNYNNENKEKDTSNIYLLVPVYYEQKIIKKLVNHFYKISKANNIKTIIISTNKEECENNTHDLALKEIDLLKANDYVEIIKYPNKRGVMAHQLNYGLDYIRTFDKTNFIAGFYNADSILKGTEFEYVRRNISDKRCIQQYSYFNNESNNIFINGLVSWQNRWSFIFEAGRVKFNSMLKNNLLSNIFLRKMNYVIGHGLYIKNNSLVKVGNIPEDTINEDAFLGVLLDYSNIDIVPMPYFEKSDFIDKVKKYIKQQCVWFNGPKDAFLYYKKIVNNQDNNKYIRKLFNKSISNRIKLFSICFKLYLHAVYWISAIYILLILYSYAAFSVFGFIGFLIALLINYINILGFNYISYLSIKSITKDDIKFSIFQFPLFSYLIHTFGPFMNVYKTIIGKNSINNKYKTER